ncbi:MAG: aminotransferase class [Roseomonas sp.]|nr:aminotransferase class [Roseomonas sp.]
MRPASRVARALRPPHLLGLRVPVGIDISTLVAAMAEQSVYVVERAGCIRIGAHVYNDEEDIARFRLALRDAMGMC